MLFNSYTFLFIFFPITTFIFFILGSIHRYSALIFLAASSLFFYGFWRKEDLLLFCLSISVNYFLGRTLVQRTHSPSAYSARRTSLIGITAVAFNLGILAFFKYFNFFAENWNFLAGKSGFPPITHQAILLPIGISFYCFTQIAFIVDCWKGKVRETDFGLYTLFVSYYPHLVAGPIIHHAQIMPQLKAASGTRLQAKNGLIGLTVFALGLSKKLLIADPLSSYVAVLHGSLKNGVEPGLCMAWLGTLAYTFQIYFDFSGYSDMAVGVSRVLGVKLPFNFNSPYRSKNIIEFWRRWHISLSEFLRDYLYIPLGGNRFGPFRRHAHLLTTMILGGLWHGASWNFILWGLLHGIYLVLNHSIAGKNWKIPSLIKHVTCFFSVHIGWVFFRSSDLKGTFKILKGLIGFNGIALPPSIAAHLKSFSGHFITSDGFWQNQLSRDLSTSHLALLLFAALAISQIPLNSNRFSKSEFYEMLSAKSLFILGFSVAILFISCVSLIYKPSPFLYFQF